MAIGIKHLRKTSKSLGNKKKLSIETLPMMSILVPAKDEERVVGRLIQSLLRLDYPVEKREIIIVEDGSSDATTKICARYVERYPDQMRLLHQSASNGKPSALNCALEHARGDIVAVFDADSVAEPEALLKAAGYFEDDSVAAVQGRPCAINADESMLSKFISYEEAVRYETYMRGKDALNLFVPLTGSCYFVRRTVLDRIGGWNEGSLSEDMELSSRLIENGHSIRYAEDVRAWQENPASLGQLFGQRVRWFRGCMEVSIRYGRLVRKIDRRCIDAEITLFGPFMFVPFLFSYLLGLYAILDSIQPDLAIVVMTEATMVLMTVTLFLIGLGLFYLAKPRRSRDLLWVPFVYAYLSVQSFVALYALLQIVFRRPRRWVKTAKVGTVSDPCLPK